VTLSRFRRSVPSRGMKYGIVDERPAVRSRRSVVVDGAGELIGRGWIEPGHRGDALAKSNGRFVFPWTRANAW